MNNYLRVDSRYASISERFQKFLCPILQGLGNFSFFIHSYMVVLATLNVFIKSSICSISSSGILLPFCFVNLHSYTMLYVKNQLYKNDVLTCSYM